MTRVPRRAFLWQALAACSAACAAPFRSVHAVPVLPVDRAARAGAAYFGDNADAVRSIGEAYVRQLGQQANRESVLAATRGTLMVINRSRDDPDAIRALVLAVREDFVRGRSVQVEGWILSRTEAEICALTLLADPVSDRRR
jgi:hypothetical protein